MMTKIKIKCISPFQPQGVVEVEQSEVKSLLETGHYLLVEDTSNKVELKKDLSKKEPKYGKSE